MDYLVNNLLMIAGFRKVLVEAFTIVQFPAAFSNLFILLPAHSINIGLTNL
jgi:hypothetical protein